MPQDFTYPEKETDLWRTTRLDRDNLRNRGAHNYRGIARLAAVGIYGVLAYTVGQRTHEIGVRMALGARTSDVPWLVLRQGLAMIGVGLAIGFVAALALTRVMESLLFGVGTRDPMTFVAVALVLTAVACAACFAPAWRAARVDPMVALRYE